jgi:hypothetical protein
MVEDGFHGDDYVAFTEFKSTGFWEFTERTFFFEDANFYWRPLGKVFHRGLYEAFGLDPAAFRVASLTIFALTLLALYGFCIRERLGGLIALMAVAFFGFFPNHVVSVAWVTNASRLLALLCLLFSLMCLQKGGARWPVAREVAAFLFFLAGCLCDETLLGLAPVPVIYGALIRDERLHLRSAAIRLLAYAAPVAVLVPLQFAQTLNDEPRLASYGFGAHMLKQAWALMGQLTLPIADARPIDVHFASIPALEWGAGAGALAAGIALLAVGSNRMRFYVLWTGLSLAPFTLWDLDRTAPRYVYLAAVPFAVVVAWCSMAAFDVLWRRLASLKPMAGSLARARLLAAATVGLISTGLLLAPTAQARNEAWADEAGLYETLAEDLQAAAPSVQPGTMIIILNGRWTNFWASAVARTLYGDSTVSVVCVLPEHVNLPRPPARSSDIVLEFTGSSLIPANTNSRPTRP